MLEFKFDYYPAKLDVKDIQPLINLCLEYRESIGPSPAVGFDQEVNLLCRIDFNKGRGTLNDVRQVLSDSPLLDYVGNYIDQAEQFGIKEVSTFRSWIQGSDDRLPNHPIHKLSAHTHPFRMPGDLDPVNTYTVISPLHIREDITENFWAKKVDDTNSTIPKKWAMLNPKFVKLIEVVSKMDGAESNRLAEFMEWWEHLRTITPGEETVAMLPNAGEQMVVNFNSKNWLHGIDSICSNLYLFILFDDYTT